MPSFRLSMHPSYKDARHAQNGAPALGTVAPGGAGRLAPSDRFERRLRRISHFQAGFAQARSDPPFFSTVALALVFGLAVALTVWRFYNLRH